jgi:probable F420-dependent oxidoreductase
MPKPFRFAACDVVADSKTEWIALARKVESIGFSTLEITDHFNAQFAPVAALMAAADCTTTLRIGTEVFCNDYRHPLILAMECATLDVLSEGRFEIGIGAGWMSTDYLKSGIPMDTPKVRVDRLEESLKVLKGCFGEGPFSFAGEHYQIEGHDGLPKSVQRPHPPILIGGGSPRVLRLAGREADIVNFNFDLRSDATATSSYRRFYTVPEIIETGTADAVEQKVGWVREGAGSRFDNLELGVSCYLTSVTDNYMAAAEEFGEASGVSAETILNLPFGLIGSIERMVDVLTERRERYGLNHITFPMALIPDGYKKLAPLIERLAGT